MSQEYLKKLFTPFSQEDMGYKREFEGNGLGLALVKKYVELNDAEIFVKSEKSKGTTFKVVFKKSADKKAYVSLKDNTKVIS
jgi:signal transduction histidine kinase